MAHKLGRVIPMTAQSSGSPETVPDNATAPDIEDFTPKPQVANYFIIPEHGGGDGGGNMEARIAKLESDVGHIQSDIKDIKGNVTEIKKNFREDFRVLIKYLVGAALLLGSGIVGLTGLMARGFGWI